MISIRDYNPNTDSPAVLALYKNSETFGGQFDEARDTSERLEKLTQKKPNAILVAVSDDVIVGTVSLFEDGRSAWLYRFAVVSNESEKEVAEALFVKVREILKVLGHTQVLVYAPAGDTTFEKRYTEIGFTKGNDFTAYWQNL